MKDKKMTAAELRSNSRFAELASDKANKMGIAIDFTTPLGTFRAWPSGRITKLDSDGDSVATVLPGAPRKITVTLTEAAFAHLLAKWKSGLLGQSIEEAAERLLCEALR